MAASDRRLDIPKELLEAAKKKAEKEVLAVLLKAGVRRPYKPIIDRDFLSIAAGGWGPLLVEELVKLGFTEASTGKPRQRMMGDTAWKALGVAALDVSITKADLLRAGLKMIVEHGLPDITDDKLEGLLEVKDERRRFGLK